MHPSDNQLTSYIIPPERNGKTLHLLKARSKPVQSGRVRKKIPLLGTFGQYKESKGKPPPTKPGQPSSTIQPPNIGQPPKPDPKNLSNYFGGGGGKGKKDAKAYAADGGVDVKGLLAGDPEFDSPLAEFFEKNGLKELA